jgi:hypothetical protein
MTQDLNPYDVDRQYIIDFYARWWKIPTESQIEFFCERVAMACQDNEFDENEIRKQIADKMIYG